MSAYSLDRAIIARSPIWGDAMSVVRSADVPASPSASRTASARSVASSGVRLPSWTVSRKRANPSWNTSPISLAIERGILLALVLIAAVMLASYSRSANAQSTATDTAGTMSSSDAASTSKATKKAQRKVAHNARQAELKKLEDNGYEPSEDRANYPTDIQNAEKKANGEPASTTP